MLCVLSAGLQPPFGHITVISHAADLSTSPLRPACFRVTSCTSAMVGTYALRNSFLLTVWLRCRFIQAATALPLALSFVALLLMLVVGLRCVFCLISAFYVHVRHPRSSLLQHVITPSVFTLRPFALSLSSWRVLVAYAFRTSLGIKLRPIFILLVEGGGFGPPAHPRPFKMSPPLWSDAVALVSVGGPHPLIPILPVCANYPGFYLPNMSILIALCFR